MLLLLLLLMVMLKCLQSSIDIVTMDILLLMFLLFTNYVSLLWCNYSLGKANVPAHRVDW